MPAWFAVKLGGMESRGEFGGGAAATRADSRAPMSASAADVRRLAEALDPLASPALRLLCARRPGPVQTYLDLRREAMEADLTSAAAADFRRRFNGYYGVRRGEAWRAAFYAAFEWAKVADLPCRPLFAEALGRLHAETRRVEASFASKLVATLRPSAPVIDSVVRAFLARHAPGPPFLSAVTPACGYFAWLEDLMGRLAATPESQAWAERFDRAFGDIAGAERIDPVKKLDFLIWGGSRA